MKRPRSGDAEAANAGKCEGGGGAGGAAEEFSSSPERVGHDLILTI